MNWKKLGQIFCPDNHFSWMKSHAAIPTATPLGDDVFRIFFSTRDGNNKSHGGYIDFDIINLKIKSISEKPVLAPGAIGLFDDAGVTLTSFLKEEGLFYYMGWHLPKSVPFSNQIGCAKFENGQLEQLTKISRMPILGKCEQESFSFGYPWVSRIQNTYYMWYDTNLEWNENSTSNYRFELRLAKSDDGINWKKTYKNCLELESAERSVARPCVIYENQTFRMWYSINNNGKYHLGYAESQDGQSWNRKDNLVGISKSTAGWDSEEIEYPFVFDYKEKRYMLYNGNSYGKTGIGLAVMTSEDR